jgi:hypothetical protein
LLANSTFPCITDQIVISTTDIKKWNQIHKARFALQCYSLGTLIHCVHYSPYSFPKLPLSSTSTSTLYGLLDLTWESGNRSRKSQ